MAEEPEPPINNEKLEADQNLITLVKAKAE